MKRLFHIYLNKHLTIFSVSRKLLQVIMTLLEVRFDKIKKYYFEQIIRCMKWIR